eukprot:480656-Rhodomonas_salina.1
MAARLLRSFRWASLRSSYHATGSVWFQKDCIPSSDSFGYRISVFLVLRGFDCGFVWPYRTSPRQLYVTSGHRLARFSRAFVSTGHRVSSTFGARLSVPDIASIAHA